MNAPRSRLSRNALTRGLFASITRTRALVSSTAMIPPGAASLLTVPSMSCRLVRPARRGSPRPAQRSTPPRTRRRNARRSDPAQRTAPAIQRRTSAPAGHAPAPRRAAIPLSAPRGEVPVFLQGDNHRGRAAPAFDDQRLVRPSGLGHGVTQRSFAHGLARVIGRHFSPHPGVILGPDATIVNRENVLLLLTAIPEYIILLHKRVIPEAGGFRP